MGANTIGAKECNKQTPGNKQKQNVDLQVSLLDCFVQDSNQFELNRLLSEIKGGFVRVSGFAPRLKQIVEVIDSSIERYVNNKDVAHINIRFELPSYHDELNIAFEDVFIHKKNSVTLGGEQVNIRLFNLKSEKVKIELICSLTDITEDVAKQYLIVGKHSATDALNVISDNADAIVEAGRNAALILDQLVSPVVDTTQVVSKLFNLPVAFGYDPRLGSNGLIYSMFKGNQYVKVVGKLSNIQIMTASVGKFGKWGWLNLLRIPETVVKVSDSKTKEEAGKVIGGTLGGMAGGEIGGNIGWVVGVMLIGAAGVVSSPAMIVTLGGCFIVGVVVGSVAGTKGGEYTFGLLGRQLDPQTKTRPLSSIEATISAAPERKTYISAPTPKPTYISAAPKRKTYISATPSRFQPLLYSSK